MEATMIDWGTVFNGAGIALLSSACLVAGLAVWDRNGRRYLAVMWWVCAALFSLLAVSTVITASAGETALSRALRQVQWARSSLTGITIYLTVVVRRREARDRVVATVAVVNEYSDQPLSHFIEASR
jgi:hypothetical protein